MEESVRVVAPRGHWRRARPTLLAGLGLALAAGCAEHAGGKAATGAIEALEEKGAAAPPGERPIELVTGRAVDAAIARLSQPQQTAALQALAGAIAEAAVQRALETALARTAPGTASPVERLAVQSADSMRETLSAGLAGDLASPGSARLGEAMVHVAREATAAATDGALARLFPGCAPGDAPCLDRRVAQLSRGAAAGFVSGVKESLATVAVVLAFAAGAVCTLVVLLVVRILRSRPSPRRSPGLAHAS
jgi:hypothetical protein